MIVEFTSNKNIDEKSKENLLKLANLKEQKVRSDLLIQDIRTRFSNLEYVNNVYFAIVIGTVRNCSQPRLSHLVGQL